MITEKVSTRVPVDALNRVRTDHPETSGMATSKLLRYLIAIAIGEDPKTFVEDPRKGNPRKTPETTTS